MSIIAGFQVPAMPFKDVAGSEGAVDPAQNVILVNFGITTGFERITPALRLVLHPLISRMKSEYKPALKPDIMICPEAFAVMLAGPTVFPSSV